MKSRDNEEDLRIDTDGDVWRFDLIRRGKRLGWLFAVRKDERLLLSDIVLENSKYKGRGIGRRLLDAFLKTAQESGITEIWGSVTQDDIEQTPYLLDWYARLGFTISDPDEECVHTAAKKIVMKLTKGHEG
ncbi:MAG TPA: GNAT family N-acetyltransferase [Kiritimatiellia bacterium]|nr:GNAT family N-acetyltransferase [Kiritimatiellia bacterium]HSA19131.1 GNAT family N-acetyltransferase [Kiritimatiellia bacterium]